MLWSAISGNTRQATDTSGNSGGATGSSPEQSSCNPFDRGRRRARRRSLENDPLTNIEMQLHRFQAVMPVRLKRQHVAPRLARQPHALQFAVALFLIQRRVLV